MIKRAIIWPDTHIGCEVDGETPHDKRAIDLVLDICRDIQPEYLYLLGDFGEFESVSSHSRCPKTKSFLKDEVYEIHQVLRRINLAMPDTEKHYISGNHELRIARYIRDNCPDLFGCVAIPEILTLDEYGFKFHEYGTNQLVRIANSHLYARHEPYGRTAEASAKKALCSIINGHDHKIQEAQIVSATGENYRCISTGWLGNQNCKIFNYNKTRPQWAHGFSIVTILEDGTWFNQIVHIIDYQCVVGDTLYKG